MSAAPVVFHDFDPEPEVEFIHVEPAPADPELGVAPEPIFAPDPILVDAPVDVPFVLPVTPPAAPVSAPVDVPLFHPHVSDTHRTGLPTTFLQDIPPPCPGEGLSTGPHGHMPPMTAAFPYIPPFAPTAHTTFTSSTHPVEPFMWSSPNAMPLSDPYHPFHVGYTTDDVLISLQLQ
ncbi:pollen-specific leucine-rich repeat extensin-like protein 3 [Helianthus annuus]|uniref:pollen-specific leucine-rich repeat extensin-like protein 3 n=1 Tax=Helianthus annuus TaxID=4232 RepID=UPI000B9020D5|nr:pollen-specific leucine-rich repeat extensin-like protein 3 [Helianthus annuus]